MPTTTTPPPLTPPTPGTLLARYNMPRTPTREIITRLRVNALGLAIDRDHRTTLPRAGQDTPAGYRRAPPAPGSLHVQQLRQTLEAIAREERQAAHEERETGRHARGPRFRLELLRRKATRLQAELETINTAPRRARDGAYVCRVPAARITSLEHPDGITTDPEILHVSITHDDWQALTPWRHQDNDRARGPHAIYRRRGTQLELRSGLETTAIILRRILSAHDIPARASTPGTAADTPNPRST